MGSASQVAEVSSNVSGGGGGGDEFYEDIEAPKFVDFTAPDHHSHDDRYWFCSRVGCDRKHEEDMDPDEIYKKFVLRVMAARSPNVRLRKVLSRKPINATKCPLSAPPKPSRPRVSRLAVLSSISKKLIDGKERAKPVCPVTATPRPKVKKPALASNAMTTPGNKKSVLKPELFRSVRNPKETTVPVQSAKVIAKALTFQSPKKGAKKKESSELDESIKKISAGMKKLDITGQRKNMLGYENRKLPLDASKKRLGAREVKSRVYDSLRSQSHKVKANGPSKCMKTKGISTELTKCVDPVGHDVSSGNSSDMEVDSHHGSLEETYAAVATKSELLEVPIVQAGLDELTTELTLYVEKLVPSLEETIQEINACNGDVLAANHKEGSHKVSKNAATQNVHDNACNEDVITANDKQGSHEVSGNDDKENLSVLNDNRGRNEASENDEKENASDRDNNRGKSEGKILCKQGTKGKIQKATQKDIKGLKEKAADPRSSEGGKCIKPRPTNPKPFRLRTDERGILKETNLEKKKLLTALKETSSTVSGFPAGTLQTKKHQHSLKRNINVPEQCEDESGHQQSEAKIDRMQQHGPRIGSKFSNSSQKVRMQKLSTLTSERCVVLKQQRTTIVTSLRQSRAKLLLLKQQPQRSTISSKKATVSSTAQKGHILEETSGKRMESKEMKLNQNAANSGIRTASPGVFRSLSRGRRPLTVPKEPNFHTVHVPKSCAQKLAQPL